MSTLSQWRRFCWQLLALTAGCVTLCYAYILAFDPYGLWKQQPIMDINQRYMYPQIARYGGYNSAIFGTSTIRLLDPQMLSQELGEELGSRFANLGMNAATPWEQMQIADLFLRSHPKPQHLIFGLDRNWCEQDADQESKRLTFRSFPPWLYDRHILNDLSGIFNLKTLEMASRVMMYRLNLMPERIRKDGFEIFTPPENTYNLEQARGHIWENRPRVLQVQDPPIQVPEQELKNLRFPALAWLDQLLDKLEKPARMTFLLPPIHASAQAVPGTREAAFDTECKSRIKHMATKYQAQFVDERVFSTITSQDDNYWDPLHYRLPVATWLVQRLKN